VNGVGVCRSPDVASLFLASCGPFFLGRVLSCSRAYRAQAQRRLESLFDEYHEVSDELPTPNSVADQSLLVSFEVPECCDQSSACSFIRAVQLQQNSNETSPCGQIRLRSIPFAMKLFTDGFWCLLSYSLCCADLKTCSWSSIRNLPRTGRQLGPILTSLFEFILALI